MWKTPRVTHSTLIEPVSGATIELDTPAWFAWLADEQHRCFHFDDSKGGFTARKERKQRGSWYWVAYRQVDHKLHKVYLGKAETLNHSRLVAANQTLAEIAASSPSSELSP